MEGDSPEWLTHENLTLIVQKHLKSDRFQIVKHQLTYLSERLGLLGEHAVLKIETNIDSKRPVNKILSFFVKLFPKSLGAVEFAEGTGAFDKEIFIYDVFDKIREENVELINNCVARCYLKGQKFYLVFDDLLDQGYKTLNKREVLGYDQVAVVLQSLSTLHASSIVLEEKLSSKLGKPYRLIEEYPQEFEESYFNDKEDYACKHHIDACFRGVLKEIDLFGFPEKLLSGKDFKKVLNEVLHNVYRMVKPSSTHRNVVCHGDLWATNFLVKCDPQGKPVACKFVDFQYGRYCPPAQDVLALLYLTTSREFRHKHMYNLLGMYYNNLEKCLAVSGYNLSEIIPFPDFLTSCEEQKQFALVQTSTYFPLVLINEDVNTKYFSDEELYHKYLVEDRSLLVSDNMDKDENYKQRVYDSVLDLKEYCERL